MTNVKTSPFHGTALDAARHNLAFAIERGKPADVIAHLTENVERAKAEECPAADRFGRECLRGAAHDGRHRGIGGQW